MRDDSCSICSASVKIMSLVLESCLMTSLTQSLMPSFCGSLMSLAGMMPGPDRAGVVEALLADPVPFERRGIRKLVALAEVARRQLVGDRVAGDVVERLGERHVLGGLADHGAELGLPVDRLRRLRQLHRRLVAGHRARRLDEVPRLQARPRADRAPAGCPAASPSPSCGRCSWRRRSRSPTATAPAPAAWRLPSGWLLSLLLPAAAAAFFSAPFADDQSLRMSSTLA